MRTPTSVIIDRRQANRTLLEIVQTSFHLSRKAALDALQNRQVRICGGACVDPQRRVKVGQHIQLEAKPAETAKPGVPAIARQIVVRYSDDHLLVVEKPAGLTTVRHADEVASLGKRAKKFLPPTLVDLLPGVLRAKINRPHSSRASHRQGDERPRGTCAHP